MLDVFFIADVAVLPRWIRVSQALDYLAGVHPRFDRAKAESFLAKTNIKRASKVHELSKGMVAQLHLALVMAIDARLLVLDEPTLGLDILYRKQFYDSLLNDYFDRNRTIVVTTHQVEEIQDVLTDLMFIDHGRIVLNCSMEELELRYSEVMVNPDQLAAARALGPIHERRSILLFDRVSGDHLCPAWGGAHPRHRGLVCCCDGQFIGPATKQPPGSVQMTVSRTTRPSGHSIHRQLLPCRAFLPLVAICILEKIAMNTSHFANLLEYRVIGWFGRAFVRFCIQNCHLQVLNGRLYRG